MQAQTQSTIATRLVYEAVQDQNPNDWRVEAIDTKTGDIFVAVFSGPLAQERATEYADFKNIKDLIRGHSLDDGSARAVVVNSP